MERDINYKEILEKRAKESKVYSHHQLIGLMLAEILQDEKHKSLYIKLAKEHDADKLIKLAKRIAEKKDIKKKGAYFMRMLYLEKEEKN